MKTGVNLSEQYTKFVDQPICSLYCPCPFASRLISPYGSDNAKLLSQNNLMKWGRFVNMAKSGGSNCEGYES